MTPAELKNTLAVASYAVATPTPETLPQMTSTTITTVTPSHLKDLLSGQASTIKKISHFTAGSLGYEFFKLTTYFKALSFLTSSETKKVIREISALDNLTGQIGNTANKVAKVLHNTILDNASSSVEKLVTLAQNLACLERHDFLGSKTVYVEALSNLVKNNSAGFLGTRTTVDNIEAFKAYLLRAIEKTDPSFTGTIHTTFSEPRAPVRRDSTAPQQQPGTHQDTAIITPTEPTAATPIATPPSHNSTAVWIMPLPANEQDEIGALVRAFPGMTDAEIDRRIGQFTPEQHRAFDVVLHQIDKQSAPVIPSLVRATQETGAISPNAAGALEALLIQESQRPHGPALRPARQASSMPATAASYPHPIFQRIAELTALVEGQNLEETDPERAAAIMAEIMEIEAKLGR
ncbi:MAG: hypothetical protein NTX49_00110 [Chlamydiae bacterium]|nr:hypothetical protein [Chlamydiota bacterium]